MVLLSQTSQKYFAQHPGLPRPSNINMLILLWEDFPAGPVVKNLSANAGDMGLIPGQGTDPLCLGAAGPVCHNY